MSSVTSSVPTAGAYDLAAIRASFPILDQMIHGQPLIYLDNGATTQKPLAVIEALAHYYRADNANVHRGVHTLSQRATAGYEGARETVRRFINAPGAESVIFTRGTTESINLVAQSFARPRLQPGDEILISWLEHHSNIVPWQLVCQQTGATLKVAPIDENGAIDQAAFRALLSERTRLVAISHISNALGTINPVADMIRDAHAAGAVVLIDGAQAVAHQGVDVQALDADFYAFSSHKLYGPTGLGVLYGRADLLEAMPPWQGGGDMIASVSFEQTTWNALPYKFEAGTPPIAAAIGLQAALDWIDSVGLSAIAAHEATLLEAGTTLLQELAGVRIIGTAPDKAAILSFVIEGVHPHDAGTLLDQLGIAIRAGHHCAQPVMDRFGIPATVRASIAAYNTTAELEALVAGIRKVQGVFGV